MVMFGNPRNRKKKTPKSDVITKNAASLAKARSDIEGLPPSVVENSWKSPKDGTWQTERIVTYGNGEATIRNVTKSDKIQILETRLTAAKKAMAFKEEELKQMAEEHAAISNVLEATKENLNTVNTKYYELIAYMKANDIEIPY
jgi:hypothetical protein